MSEAFKQLVAAVSEFNNWVVLPKLGPVTPKLMYEFTDQSLWGDQYKVSPALPGCYVFEDSNGKVIYVGSVSGNNDFGRRFGTGYLRKHPHDATKIEKLGYAVDAVRIYVIDVSKEYAFIAPALEQFLISFFDCNSKCCVVALRERLIADGHVKKDPA